jgi:hypothetical protein
MEVRFHFLEIDVRGLYLRLLGHKNVVIGIKPVAKIDSKKNIVLLLFAQPILLGVVAKLRGWTTNDSLFESR